MGVLATILIYCGTGIDSWHFLDFLRTDNAWISMLVFCLVIAYFCYQIFSSKGEKDLSGRDIQL